MGKRKGHSDADELEILKRELVKARGKGDFKEVSNIHNRIGIIYRELHLYDEALQEHEEEAAVTRRHFPEDRLGLGVALRAKGEVYLESKEEEKALPLIKEYLRKNEKIKVACEKFRSLSIGVSNLVEEQRAHVTLGRVYLALGLRYSEEGDREQEKVKFLAKAEKEFLVAKDLANHPKVRTSESESGVVEMKCGVFLNLSLVLDCVGRIDESLNYLLKAVEMAEQNKLPHLVFRAHISLYEVHMKKKAYADAASSAQAASKAAKSISNGTLQAEAGLLQAKASFMQNEIERGVSLLKRIRKDQKTEHILEELEPLLKTAVRITRTEDKLHASVVDEYKKFKIYEVLGDKYVELGNFSQAAVNYELAIQNCEFVGIDNKKKSALLFSLAETFKDLGEYANAKKFFLQELTLQKENLVEAFKTQTMLCVVLEKGNFPEDEILEAHQRAIKLAKEAQNASKEVIALNNYVLFLKSRNKNQEADKASAEAEELLKRFRCDETDSEELLGGGNDSDSGSSIDFDKLTSDEGDSDDAEEPNRAAVTIKAKQKFRVNEKGETPLHVAAKKGDLKAVCRLLRQCHEVNPRDSAGWLPIHEAANFGHVEVVSELLKNGARIDDQPSGTDCDKISPLHDAASNGHLDVVQLLVTSGANVLLRDANGNFPIDSLLVCFEGVKDNLSDEEKSKFKEMKNLLKSKMSHRGRVYGKEEEIRARRKAKSFYKVAEPQFSVVDSRGEGRIPVKVAADDFDPDDGDAAVDFYAKTIRGLRGKKKLESSEKETRNQAQALIAESDYVDEDWLEDDIGGKVMTTNKRKRELTEDFDPPSRRRREDKRNDVALLDIQPTTTRQARNNISPSPERAEMDSSQSPPCPSRSPELSSLELIEEDCQPIDIILSSSSEDELQSFSKVKSQRKIQTKLPFKRILTIEGSGVKENKTKVPSPASIVKNPQEQILRLKISIAGKVFGVPLLESQSEEPISWLCQEAAKRYFESEGLKPVLRLRTKDGALLSGNDVIRVAVGGSETELEAEVLSYDLPRLPDRFREGMTKQRNLEQREVDEILRALEICQSSDLLSLSDVNLSDRQLSGTLFNSLQCQFALRELNLSGASLFDDGVKALSMVLPTLPSIRCLNLSLNGLTVHALNHLGEAFRKKTQHVPSMSSLKCGLVSLDLSFNPLGNYAGPPLTQLLSQLQQLRKLFLADADLSPRTIRETSLVSLLARLKLEELDIRYNDVGETGKRLLLDSGAFVSLQTLNAKTFDPLNPIF